MRFGYLNGKFVPADKLVFSQYDAGPMYGLTVFEMSRTFNGKDPFLEDHLRRMYEGLRVLKIDPKINFDQMYETCLEVMSRNKEEFEANGDEHRLMINVTPGPLGIYPGPHVPTVMIDDFPLKWTVQGMGKLYEQGGVDVVIVSQRAVPARLIDPKIKNRSRMHYYIANKEAALCYGAPWALLLDEDGYLAEGSGANIFVVKGNKVKTPKHQNVLNGITAERICRYFNDVDREDITVHELMNADAAFFTASPFVIMPIRAVNGIKTIHGDKNRLMHDVLESTKGFVGLNFVDQMIKWDKEKKPQTGSSPYVSRP